jgi:hypothetical protein
MKTPALLTIATTSFLVLLPCKAADEPDIGDTIYVTQDVRKIDYFPIDVTPVLRWLKNKEGPRPLPAWKLLEIKDIKGSKAGCDYCVVKHESGDFEELLIKNLPSGLRSYILRAKSIKSDISSLKAQIDAEAKAISLSQPFRPISPAGSDADQKRVQAKRELLSRQEQELAEMRQAAKTGILALPRPYKWEGLVIWDTGLPKE